MNESKTWKAILYVAQFQLHLVGSWFSAVRELRTATDEDFNAWPRDIFAFAELLLHYGGSVDDIIIRAVGEWMENLRRRASDSDTELWTIAY